MAARASAVEARAGLAKAAALADLEVVAMVGLVRAAEHTFRRPYMSSCLRREHLRKASRSQKACKTPIRLMCKEVRHRR